MIKLIRILIIFLPFSIVSQTISGKIYDHESTVKGATIVNKSQNIKSYSDDKGHFKIKASVNDSILFYSLFHKQQILKLDEIHFNDVIVIELKKAVNDLEEVTIKNDVKEKTFSPIEHNTTFNSQLKNDLKNRPYLYGATPSNGLDLIQIANLIGSLFKKKKIKSIVEIKYQQFDSLFSNDSFFNKKLLINDLKIEKEYQSLFFEFCEAQFINNKLLSEKSKFLLLDKLITCSEEFLTILSEYKK